jgi:hypothetical protein
MDASDEGGQVAHDEARALIRAVIANHPEAKLEDDEGGDCKTRTNAPPNFSTSSWKRVGSRTGG